MDLVVGLFSQLLFPKSRMTLIPQLLANMDKKLLECSWKKWKFENLQFKLLLFHEDQVMWLKVPEQVNQLCGEHTHIHTQTYICLVHSFVQTLWTTMVHHHLFLFLVNQRICRFPNICLVWIRNQMSYKVLLFCVFKACLHIQLHSVCQDPRCAEFSIQMLWCEDKDECYNIPHYQ